MATVHTLSRRCKSLVKSVLPYQLVIYLAKKKQARREQLTWEVWKRQLFTAGWLTELRPDAAADYSYQRANDYLAELGYPLERNPDGCFAGTLSESSLAYCASFLREQFTGAPLLGLHVGNFIGVSLAYLARVVQKLHPESLIVSIDPNVQHRAVKNPLNVVVGLLNHFGLQNNAMLLTGYSLEPGAYYEVHPEKSQEDNTLTRFFDRGQSCAQQLKGLEKLASRSFDFFLIDGNHEAEYLAREIDSADRLLKPGGLLILDDVYPFWPEIQRTYKAIDRNRYDRVGTDGRVGVLKKRL